MTEGEQFKYKSSPNMERLGSNRNAVEALEQTGADQFLEELQNTNFKSFYTDDRIRVYDHIDRLYSEAEDTDKHDQVLLYAASEAVLWVAEEHFTKRPYRDSENATAYEIHERISTAHDVLVSSTYNKTLVNKSSIAGGMTLGLSLQSAVSAYESWSEQHKSIDFDRNLTEIKEISSVCVIACLDAITDLPPKDALEVQGEKPLHEYYLEQLMYLSDLGPNVVIYDFGDNIIEKVLKSASDPRTPELSSADLAFLASKADDILLMSELCDKSLNSMDMSNLSTEDVESIVLIASSVDSVNSKKELLDTAYNATVEYKFEHDEVQSNKFGWLGKLIHSHKKPLTNYEQRTSILARNVKNNLDDLLLNYPEHIKQVVELHSPADHESIWYGLAESVINLCSGRNSHGAEAIVRMTNIQTAFKSIAPEEPFEHAKEEIDYRFPEGR